MDVFVSILFPFFKLPLYNNGVIKIKIERVNSSSLLFKALNSGYTIEDLKTEEGHNKHIYCYESREHVLSYNTKGVHCSDPKCVVNSNNKIPTRNEVVFL